MWNKIKIILKDRSLRNKILFVLFALVVFRLFAAIPIPGIDAAKLQQFLNNNQFFGVMNLFSGGGLSKLSIMMLGVGPYITASIIMQLLTIMVPRLKAIYHEEGTIGRQKFTNYSQVQNKCYLHSPWPHFRVRHAHKQPTLSITQELHKP